MLFYYKIIPIIKICNVAYGLLTIGGFLTVLNIKTNALKCSIAGIFLIKGSM